ncbi:MAG: hypothetical protein J0L96_20345 [Anaerolineae bacterium]|nr:hypothetical protein [Anaerolineae bacterium]
MKDSFYELQQKVLSSFAYIIQARLETLTTNYYVFNRNYQELKKVLDAVKSPKNLFELWDLKNRDKLDIVINEVIRLFHNYLASAKTLVDHTRIVIREWYKDTAFIDEYNKEINLRFENNPLAGFVEGLKNYSLHYTLPFANATMSATIKEDGTSDIPDFSFVLYKSDLAVWSEWPKKAQAFLNGSGDEISINQIIEEYFRGVEDFHKWMFQRLNEIHRKDLEWLNDMNEKLINMMSEDEREARGLKKPTMKES